MRTQIDSKSVGDPRRFAARDRLVSALDALAAAPIGSGRLAFLVRRGRGGRREVLERARLTPAEGMPGDAWGRRVLRTATAQLAVMQHGVAELIANGQPLALFGDQLFLDMDLSAEHLPTGSRVRIGGALLEVTPKAHNGCKMFAARFGDEALQFVSEPVRRPRNLRGIYMCVLEAGDVAPGDRVDVVRSA